MRESGRNGFRDRLRAKFTGICWIPAEEISGSGLSSGSFNPARGAVYSTSDSDPGNSAPACWELPPAKPFSRARTTHPGVRRMLLSENRSDGQLFSVLQRDLNLEITPLQLDTQSASRTILTRNWRGSPLQTAGSDYYGHKRSPKQTAVSRLPTGTFRSCHPQPFQGAQPGDTLVIDYLSAPQDETASRLQKAVEKSHAELPAILTNTFDC